MKVLLLTPYPALLQIPLTAEGDEFVVSMDEPSKWPLDVDFIVSFGYNHIIREPYLSKFKDRMINIHTAVLPWNRGAFPNFWSWFDNTPKGVSIHLIEKKLDGGKMLAQIVAPEWSADATLRSTYECLLYYSGILFGAYWTRLREQAWSPVELEEVGSFHTAAETEKWLRQLPLGWDTPVAIVEALGRLHRMNETKNESGTLH